MNTNLRFFLILTLVLLAGTVLVMMSLAAPGAAPQAGGAPEVVAYQGEVQVSGTPYNGDGHFKFAIVNMAGGTTYWSNDGTSSGGGEPTNVVQLTVSDGLFNVLLGDTMLGGMTQALTGDVFGQPDRYLRVWFSTDVAGPFYQLTPDTRIAAVPYALQAQEAVDADTVDGFHANELGVNYQNVVVVAQSGGDFTSVQAAIDSVSDAGANNPYLVWVAPGVYSETVVMKPYVHLQGAGQETTVITSTTSSSGWPPTQATLVLASDVSLRDMTLGNSGTGDSNAVLLATTGMTSTLVADVTVKALGGGVINFGIAISGSGTHVTLHQVTALAENGSSHNIGLVNLTGAAVVVREGDYTGRGGGNGWGIFNAGPSSTLEAMDVIALGENGSILNNGLYNFDGAVAALFGGSFTGRGGNQTGGVSNQQNGILTATDISVLAENGSDNYGLGNFDGTAMTVRDVAVIARGGLANYALTNELNVTMEAENVTALAENGSNSNYGFWNVNGAQATVYGGVFTGRGGVDAAGIYNSASGTTLDAEGIFALGENGSSSSYGLLSADTAIANLTQSVLEGATNSVNQGTGSVTVSNTRLVDGTVAGPVTCVLVTRGTTVSTDGSTCP